MNDNSIIELLKEIKEFCKKHDCDTCLIYEECQDYFNQAPANWYSKPIQGKERQGDNNNV